MRKKMTILILVAVVLAVALAVAAYFSLFGRANPPLPPGTVAVGGTTFHAEFATTTIAQARGLSYRDSLADGVGMLFVFGSPGVQNFWMKDMNFPLDMIWIGPGANGKDQVLGVSENAIPQPGAQLWQLKIYSSPEGTDKVLEVNAGTASKDNIHIGDPVQITSPSGI